MLCILNDRTNAAFNLAAEEYLLHHCREDCCMLWRNHRAIIVGRNQNPWSQVDARRVQRHGIPVLRRLTGGGTVFQDTGNINFTFIRCRRGTPSLDFSPFLAPITAFLTTVGLNVRSGKAGALFLQGRKISGNAQFIHRGRTLHHGTLLFDVNLQELGEVLADHSHFYEGAGVDSIRKPVINLKPPLDDPRDATDFMERLFAFIRKFTGGRQGMLLPADILKIETLAQKKYRTWRWNFGRSPGYRFKKRSQLKGQRLEAALEVRSGIIRRARLTDLAPGGSRISDLEAVLAGRRHTPSAVLQAIAENPGPFCGASPEEIITALF